MEKELIVAAKEVHKAFQNKPVLRGINLNMEPGDLTVLIGPSGCGKSTFLRCLNGLESIDSGEVVIDKIKLRGTNEVGLTEFETRSLQVRQSVGMVFQSFNLFPHLTVLENIMKSPMVVKKISKEQAEEKALRLLKKVGLDTHVDHYPYELSGGQQQRAAIARALAMEPKVLLYDEPTSALDPMLVDEVLQVRKQLDLEGMTQVVVTHEMRLARDVADHIAYIEEGSIVEMGSPSQIFGCPKDERTRKFLKHFI